MIISKIINYAEIDMTNYQVYIFLRGYYPKLNYKHWQIIFGNDTQRFEDDYQEYLSQMNLETQRSRL